MPTETRTGRKLWPYVLGCVTVLLAGLLWSGLSSSQVAYAQVPDSGAQFNEMIKELRISNQKLTEIAGYLHEMRDAQAADRKEKASKPPADKP